jgi:hypothetical protein
MRTRDRKRSNGSRMMANMIAWFGRERQGESRDGRNGLRSRLIAVVLCCCVLTVPAGAQSFSVGGSLTGVGVFGTGLLSTGIPGVIGAELRVEALNLIARGVSLRADVGTQGVDAMIFWRADLSEAFNLTLGAGLAWLEYFAPGLVARVGLEYRFNRFAVTLEYGWRSSFETVTPTFRSQWALGVVLFL